MSAQKPVDFLTDYVTPVSVDAFGSCPGKKAGDRFEVMYYGRVYIATVQDGAARQQANGTILRNVHFQQACGPVTRMFLSNPIIEELTRRWVH